MNMLNWPQVLPHKQKLHVFFNYSRVNTIKIIAQYATYYTIFIISNFWMF